MPDQSLLERITEALDERMAGFAPLSREVRGYRARALARAVLVVVGERDAEIAEHVGSVSMHAVVLMQNTVEDSDDWHQASKALEHSEAALALLGPTDTQDAS